MWQGVCILPWINDAATEEHGILETKISVKTKISINRLFWTKLYQHLFLGYGNKMFTPPKTFPPGHFASVFFPLFPP